MKPARLLPFVALLAIASSAAAEPVPYTSKQFGFSVTFPFAIKESGDEAGATVASIDPAGVMYMVGVTAENKEVAKRKTPRQQLDDGLQGALEKVKGTLETQHDITLGKYPGREVEIALKGGHATFRAYVVGPHIYLIGVVHADGKTLPMPAADFFASFSLKGKR